jgi:hypothetical protein
MTPGPAYSYLNRSPKVSLLFPPPFSSMIPSMRNRSSGDAGHRDERGRGPRLLLWGWTCLIILCLAGIPLTKDMIGVYGRGKIFIQPFMTLYNTVILTAHLLGLGLVTAGALFLRNHAESRLAKGSGRAALAMLGFTLATLLAMLLVPWWMGSGPWPPDSLQVATMRTLVYLPGVTRTLAWGLMIVAMVQGHMTRGGAVPRWRYFLLLGLVALDLGLTIWKWIITPKAVIALLHPLSMEPLCMAPWILGGVLFVLMLRFDLFGQEFKR